MIARRVVQRALIVHVKGGWVRHRVNQWRTLTYRQVTR